MSHPRAIEKTLSTLNEHILQKKQPNEDTDDKEKLALWRANHVNWKAELEKLHLKYSEAIKAVGLKSRAFKLPKTSTPTLNEASHTTLNSRHGLASSKQLKSQPTQARRMTKAGGSGANITNIMIKRVN